MITDGNEVSSKTDKIVLFKAIASNPIGNGAAIDFFDQHLKKLSNM